MYLGQGQVPGVGRGNGSSAAIRRDNPGNGDPMDRSIVNPSAISNPNLIIKARIIHAMLTHVYRSRQLASSISTLYFVVNRILEKHNITNLNKWKI